MKILHIINASVVSGILVISGCQINDQQSSPTEESVDGATIQGQFDLTSQNTSLQKQYHSSKNAKAKICLRQQKGHHLETIDSLYSEDG